MIDLYTWTTPNGRKVSIMLEELGEAYEVHPVNLDRDENKTTAYLDIAPSGRIPAVRDGDTGMTLMESGAILLWLAEKHGRFLPEGIQLWKVLEWSFWQVGQLGPFLGQAHQVLKYENGKTPFWEAKSREQVARSYETLDARLKGRRYLAGEGSGEYSIADILSWPWVSRFEWHQADLSDYPAVRDWYLRIAERPAVQKGYHVPHFVSNIPMP